MSMYRAISTKMAALLLLASCAALPAEVSEPDGDYLLEVAQNWAAKAGLVNIKDSKFENGDIELRLWGGFGVRGTSAIVLYRRDGVWGSQSLNIKHYYAGGTEKSAANRGLLPPSVAKDMEYRCIVEIIGNQDGAIEEYSLECPYLEPTWPELTQEEYRQLWSELLEHRVLNMPPEIERDWIMMDGHSYVLQVRTTEQYRASSIESTTETSEDKAMQAIAALIDKTLSSQVSCKSLDTC